MDDAERRFLSVRQEAQDSPTYKLGYGQVLHRLGRPEEGDKLLGSLLATGETPMQLEVAFVYRSLGNEARARELYEQVYEKGVPAQRDEAALSIAAFARSLEDRELWLNRVKTKSPGLTADLASTRGERLLHEGKRAQADREFAKAAAHHLRLSDNSVAAANNAAVALKARYQCTGDVKYLDQAADLFRAALRREPDNALIIQNYADIVEFRLTLSLLARRVHLRSLPLADASASSAVQLLWSGPASPTPARCTGSTSSATTPRPRAS
jgi:tetratricopeptide (TPR) repeat protein